MTGMTKSLSNPPFWSKGRHAHLAIALVHPILSLRYVFPLCFLLAHSPSVLTQELQATPPPCHAQAHHQSVGLLFLYLNSCWLVLPHLTFIWLNLTSAVKKHNQKSGEVKWLYIDCALTFAWLLFYWVYHCWNYCIRVAIPDLICSMHSVWCPLINTPRESFCQAMPRNVTKCRWVDGCMLPQSSNSTKPIPPSIDWDQSFMKKGIKVLRRQLSAWWYRRSATSNWTSSLNGIQSPMCEAWDCGKAPGGKNLPLELCGRATVLHTNTQQGMPLEQECNLHHPLARPCNPSQHPDTGS